MIVTSLRNSKFLAQVILGGASGYGNGLDRPVVGQALPAD